MFYAVIHGQIDLLISKHKDGVDCKGNNKTDKGIALEKISPHKSFDALSHIPCLF